MKVFRSIRVQIISIMTCIGLVIGLAMMVTIPPRAANIESQVLQNDIRLISSLLARDLATISASADPGTDQALQRGLATLREEISTSGSLISDLRVYDAHGRLLAAMNESSGGPDRITPVSIIHTEETAENLLVSTPLLDQNQNQIGSARIEFSRVLLEDQATGDTWFALLLALGITLTTGLTGYLMSRRIAGPIGEIAQAADTIAGGDFDYELNITATNEIGDLAAAFGRLAGYMKEMVAAARALAGNNLTVAVRPRGKKDALGKAFSIMVHNLTSVIIQLSDYARNLADSADQLAGLSDDLLNGSRSQQAQIEQVSTAIQEMTATVVESSRHADDAAGASQQAAGTAGIGGQVVGDTLHAMERIAEVVTAVSQSIGDLSESAGQIGGIVNVIDEVADQTNLLALNAAIEAARAGEQGRGFAVVADEVRNLADRTAHATAEISGKIKAIQDKTNGVVSTMDESIEEVKLGQDMARKASSSLTEIVAMARQVTDMITQIASATDEQSAVAEQISENAEQISRVTRTTLEAAQQSACAAAGLNDQAASLRRLVAKFQLPPSR